MLSSTTQVLLANYLKSIAEAEINVETTRLVLAEKKDFEPYSAFCYIDRLSKGYISPRDVIEFLEELNLIPLESQVLHFFDLHGSQNERRLSYSDFKNAVLPATDIYLRELATSRLALQSGESLSYGASWALARVFEREFQSYKDLEAKRENLVGQVDWDSTTAFRTIDRERLGYIDPEAVQVLFKRCQSILTQTEMDALFKRGDKNNDGKLDMSEFLGLFHPLGVTSDRMTAGSPTRKQRSPSPRRQGASPRFTSSPQRSLQQQDLSTIRDNEYNRYLRESTRLHSPTRRAEESPARRSRWTERQSPKAYSPQRETHKSKSRSRSPSFKKELTDYRIDSGYRTIKTFENSPSKSTFGRPSEMIAENYEVSPQRNSRRRQSPRSERSQSRSKSPRFKSDLTDYRVTSAYRTIKTFDEDLTTQYSSPQRGRADITALNASRAQPEERRTSPRHTELRGSEYKYSHSPNKHRSPPRYKLEPTSYREGTAYRTVKTYDRGVSPSKEAETGVKEAQSPQANLRQNEADITKKLQFESPYDVKAK